MRKICGGKGLRPPPVMGDEGASGMRAFVQSRGSDGSTGCDSNLVAEEVECTVVGLGFVLCT